MVNGRQPKVPSATLVERWKPPENGWLKLNSDGVLAKSLDRGGGGVFLRDHVGAFRGAASCVFNGVSDPEVAEILACRKAVQMAVQRGAQKIHLEVDNKGVAAMINDKERNLSAAGAIIQEVKALLNTRQDYKVTWVRCSGNNAAHVLAREGLGLVSSKEWPVVPPDCILSVISDEIPSVGN